MKWFKRLFRSYRNEQIIDNLKERISELESRGKEDARLLNTHIEHVSNLGDVYLQRLDDADKKIKQLLLDKESLAKTLKQISKRVARLEIQHTRWFKKVSDDYSTAMMSVASESNKFSIFATKQIEEKANELSKSVVSSMMESKDFMQLFSDLEYRMNERFVLKDEPTTHKSQSEDPKEEARVKATTNIFINGAMVQVYTEHASYQDIIELSGCDYIENPSIYYEYPNGDSDGASGRLLKDGIMAIKEGLEIKVVQN